MLDLASYIADYKNYELDVNHFFCRGEPSIRTVLHRNLSDAESLTLLELYFLQKEGWYLYKDGIGKKLLSIASIEMDLTNGVYAWDNEEQLELFLQLTSTISDEFGSILCSVYAKQKIATWTLLSRIHGENSSITLYRGMKVNDKNYYRPNGLESYTTDIKTARRFATTEKGIILKRDVPINQIFAYASTVYKTFDCPSKKIRNLISKEKEYIVENKEDYFKLSKIKSTDVYDVIPLDTQKITLKEGL